MQAQKTKKQFQRLIAKFMRIGKLNKKDEPPLKRIYRLDYWKFSSWLNKKYIIKDIYWRGRNRQD